MSKLDQYRKVRLGIPKDEGGMIHLDVYVGKTLEGHNGYKYLDRVILNSETFHQMHKAQMMSDFDTMRKILSDLVDLDDLSNLTMQKNIVRLLFL